MKVVVERERKRVCLQRQGDLIKMRRSNGAPRQSWPVLPAAGSMRTGPCSNVVHVFFSVRTFDVYS